MAAVIIIGTGFAGYTLAREFRKLDSDTPLILITSDDGRSYPKPMLSNALAKGKTADQIAMFDACKMASTLSAEIMTNVEVDGVDPQSQTVTLDNGKVIEYRQLVLAVGASPVKLGLDGDAANQVLSINNIVDYASFREKLADAGRVAIIGPGLIACEFANDLASTGVSVTIIGPNKFPMENLLPSPIAEQLKIKLEEIGVDWQLETSTISIDKSKESRVVITLENGVSINADIVISAVGLRANVSLAQAENLEINRGIVTDRTLQTSQENIYALGDCAEVSGHNLLFIAPILAGAKALAKTLVGDVTEVKYPAMPVAIKTPIYPLVVAPPAVGVDGEWLFETASSGFGLKGSFVDPSGNLQGFALSGDCVSEKQALAKELPALLN
ncbi:MAG: FAD-dependent oxidoreductase [Piscirickettsiaceae bacterium]|nr:FAD-dependent oxidoreductase [Piscirickettsiaceae bacterium]